MWRLLLLLDAAPLAPGVGWLLQLLLLPPPAPLLLLLLLV
jgi:hypothetical protein